MHGHVAGQQRLVRVVHHTPSRQGPQARHCAQAMQTGQLRRHARSGGGGRRRSGRSWAQLEGVGAVAPPAVRLRLRARVGEWAGGRERLALCLWPLPGQQGTCAAARERCETAGLPLQLPSTQQGSQSVPTQFTQPGTAPSPLVSPARWARCRPPPATPAAAPGHAARPPRPQQRPQQAPRRRQLPLAPLPEPARRAARRHLRPQRPPRLPRRRRLAAGHRAAAPPSGRWGSSAAAPATNCERAPGEQMPRGVNSEHSKSSCQVRAAAGADSWPGTCHQGIGCGQGCRAAAARVGDPSSKRSRVLPWSPGRGGPIQKGPPGPRPL